MNKLHLVPQIIIDLNENIKKTNDIHQKNVYIIRMEAIRDFCIDSLEKANKSTNVSVKNKK